MMFIEEPIIWKHTAVHFHEAERSLNSLLDEYSMQGWELVAVLQRALRSLLYFLKSKLGLNGGALAPLKRAILKLKLRKGKNRNGIRKTNH